MVIPGHEPQGPARRGLSLGIGHSGRLRSDAGVRWLVLGHLLVFALALNDEEFVGMALAAANLPERLLFPMEIAFSFLLFVAWGCLTVGWVRLVERLRRERVETPGDR